MIEGPVPQPPRGLPEELPPGEHILWQGAPVWWGLAKRVFQVRKVALYFGVLMVWAAASVLHDGHGWGAAGIAALWLAPFALAAMGLLALIAWLTSRATVYTITDKRVIVAHGVALPMTVNLPFGTIKSVALKVHGDGTGEIPLTLSLRPRIPYLAWWPHTRPWRFENPEPMMRCVPEAERVAGILSQALHSANMVSTPSNPEVSIPMARLDIRPQESQPERRERRVAAA